MPPPVASAAAGAGDELGRGRRQSKPSVKLLAEVNSLGVDELKAKIREVASARRERLQQGIVA